MAANDTSTNVFDTTRTTLRERLEELSPLVTEAEQIQQTLAFMDEHGPRKRGGARRGGSRNGGRRKVGERRSDNFLKLVASKPGITVAEAAKEMGIGPNYLYRVASDLTKDGKLDKDGSKYTVTEAGKKAANEEQQESVAAA